MTLATARAFFVWCTLINYALLIVWAGLFLTPHNRLNQFWARRCQLSIEQFSILNYAGIVLYKMGVLLFNLVPAIALYLV